MTSKLDIVRVPRTLALEGKGDLPEQWQMVECGPEKTEWPGTALKQLCQGGACIGLDRRDGVGLHR